MIVVRVPYVLDQIQNLVKEKKIHERRTKKTIDEWKKLIR